jgi:cardiolipin synthase
MTTRRWNVANLISLYRILAIPALVTMIVTHNRPVFTTLLIVSLVSDIADGLIARSFNMRTELGARLDSIGDMGTYLISVIAIFIFEFEFVKQNYILIALVIGLYVIEALFSLLKFKKISSFHTLFCKITAYCQGIFLVVLFSSGFIPWLFYITIAITITAYVEEILMVAVLKSNVSNVRGLKAALLIVKNDR